MLSPGLCYCFYTQSTISTKGGSMKNTIIKLFNLEPDELEDVQFISEGNRAFILITLKRVRQRCPQCGSSTKVVHDYRKHTLTHAILNGQYTSIVFNQRRYRCTNCNKQFSEANPFTFPLLTRECLRSPYFRS